MTKETTSNRAGWRKNLIAAGVGFAVGILAGTAYVLFLGEPYFPYTPLWALIAFYPGFWVGLKTYDWGVSELPCKVVGVLIVGCAYALLALLVRLVWAWVKRHRPV